MLRINDVALRAKERYNKLEVTEMKEDKLSDLKRLYLYPMLIPI